MLPVMQPMSEEPRPRPWFPANLRPREQEHEYGQGGNAPTGANSGTDEAFRDVDWGIDD